MSATTLTPTSATTETPKLVKKAAVGETKTPSFPTQTYFGCQHIKNLLQAAREQATNRYSQLIQCLRNERNLCDRMHRSGNVVSATGGTTYLCLQCPNITTVRQRHVKDHAFSAESNNGFIFCHECKDFVYDPTFEEIRSANGRKRKHTPVQQDGEKRLISTNTTITPCAATGLRGLYNMGQTCFMSVILQALIHNPFIRAYYLAEGHRKEDCDRDACTSCALDDIFTDFFGQDKHEGYGAVHMLQSCWKGGGGLAGYSQQDAHEFLGSILNSLHAANTSEEDEPNTSNGNTENPAAKKDDCDCIVHQIFAGLLKSTVTCTACKTTTTTLDPFMDLSLDVRTQQSTPGGGPAAKKQKIKLSNGTSTSTTSATKDNNSSSAMDLTECLERFTSAETLSSDSYRCRTCASAQTATKKMGLVRLPPVLPIHLKRFSHSKSSSLSSKVETRIRFPFSLHLGPYTTVPPSNSQTAAKSKDGTSKSDSKPTQNGTSKPSKDAPAVEDEYIPPPIYDLSSVIVHKGKIDNGHYISYSRQGDEWFRFDDSMVVQVDEKVVLAAEAYMLFYVVREIVVED